MWYLDCNGWSVRLVCHTRASNGATIVSSSEGNGAHLEQYSGRQAVLKTSVGESFRSLKRKVGKR